MSGERSIPEIVHGWTWEQCDPRNLHIETCGTWTSAAGDYEYGFKGEPPEDSVSVDEMLAWIQSKGWLWQARPTAEGPIEVSIIHESALDADGADPWEIVEPWEIEGATLLEALSSAVRAVAEDPT